MTHGLLLVNKIPFLVFKKNVFIFLDVILGYKKLCRVKGISMYPTLKDGDIVLYKPIENINMIELKKGSLVVAKNPTNSKMLIIKRFISINDYGVELIGDNKIESIDSRSFGYIPKTLIIGVVEKTYCL